MAMHLNENLDDNGEPAKPEGDLQPEKPEGEV